MDHDTTLRLLTRERRMLHAFIRGMVSDYHLVEDILQEVFVVTMEKREQFVEGTNFCAWAREIARRVSLAQLRKSGKHPPLAPDVLEALEQASDVPVESWEVERDALRKCVERLPPESRRILDLRYAEEKPLEQIAALAGRSVQGVKGLLKRVRQALAECVGGQIRGARLTEEATP